MTRQRSIAASSCAGAVLLLVLAASPPAAGDTPKIDFETLDGWRVHPVPTIQLVRFGARRRTALVTDHLDMDLDVLKSVGLGISFQPPYRPFRGLAMANGATTNVQWIGLSIIALVKGGTVARGEQFLNGAEIGFGATVDLLELLSLGVGVDLYRGIGIGDRIFHTGVIPAAFGSGAFTREDFFVTVMLNISGNLLGGFKPAGSVPANESE